MMRNERENFKYLNLRALSMADLERKFAGILAIEGFPVP
jgi:hypothetical protein